MKKMTTDALLDGIRSDNPDTRTEAWLSAGTAGAAAIKPLSGLAVSQGELETKRAARRAIWTIVRTVGLPGSPESEKQAAAGELLALLQAANQPSGFRRELLWMLSEIGSEAPEVDAIAELLLNSDLCEDARCALERIPGERSLDALQEALKTVPEDFRPHIAQSLRARGVKVSGYPSQKLVPTKG